MRFRLMTCLAAFILLAACSGDGDSDDSAGDEPGVRTTDVFGDETPYCADLWTDGNTIPTGYEGCYDEEEDTVVLSFGYDCDDGRSFVSGPPGYGFEGEEVNVTPESLDEPDVNSPEYKAAFEACRAS